MLRLVRITPTVVAQRRGDTITSMRIVITPSSRAGQILCLIGYVVWEIIMPFAFLAYIIGSVW